MKTLSLKELQSAVSKHVPKPIGDYRYYSVLLPLVEKNGEIHVLYEVRSHDLDVQPGEVSFPGGGIEEGETPREAALRETMEELGLQRSAIEIAGELDYLLTYSGFTLYCFLGVIDAEALSQTQINTEEVKEYFLVPLSWFLENEPEVYTGKIAPEIPKEFPIEKLAPRGRYKWRTGKTTIPIYTWADPDTGKERIIWGLTARLTMMFVELLQEGF